MPGPDREVLAEAGSEFMIFDITRLSRNCLGILRASPEPLSSDSVTSKGTVSHSPCPQLSSPAFRVTLLPQAQH